MKAERLNDLNGRRVYRIPVRVWLNDSTSCSTLETIDYSVTAHSAADAANYIRGLWDHRPETEIRAYGPKGGEVYRYVGFFSFIAGQLLGGETQCLQLTFDLTS